MPEKKISIQLYLSPQEREELTQQCELAALKPTEFFKSFAWDVANFVIEEARRGGEIVSERPDGTRGIMMNSRIVDRIKRSTQRGEAQPTSE